MLPLTQCIHSQAWSYPSRAMGFAAEAIPFRCGQEMQRMSMGKLIRRGQSSGAARASWCFCRWWALCYSSYWIRRSCRWCWGSFCAPLSLLLWCAHCLSQQAPQAICLILQHSAAWALLHRLIDLATTQMQGYLAGSTSPETCYCCLTCLVFFKL